jgi:uncharacterized protein (DUF58 family)
MTARGATRGAYVIGAIGAALALAARTTGAGWLIVILCGLAGVLLVGIIWPRVALSRVRIVAAGSRDATVGQATTITLTLRRVGMGVRMRPIDPPGEATAALDATPAPIVVTPGRRGLLEHIDVEAASAAPFGLVWWRRRIAVPLRRPVEVAPRRGQAERPPPTTRESPGETVASAGVGGDHVRGLREYLPGDPIRLVHWPATAHHGQIVIKELEHPERPHLDVVVDLRGDVAAAEDAAERAMDLVCSALEDGLDVTLHTAEAGGPRSAPVAGPLDAGRRLARAVAAAPPPVDAAGEVVRIGTARRPA